MIAVKSKRVVLYLCTAALLLTSAPCLAQSPNVQASSTAPAPNDPTITIFGKKRAPGDVTRAQIETNTASSCGFMNDYDPANDEVTQSYLRDFGAADNGSNQSPDTDQTDPNVAGNHFKDNSPYGNASQDNSANSNTLADLQIGTGTSGACGPSDKVFAAGRNYIARTDHSLRDAYAAFDAGDYPKALELFKASYAKIGYDSAALMIGKMYLLGIGTTRDSQQAIVWLKKVAEAKFGPSDVQSFNASNPDYASTWSDAAVSLAKIYMAGMGVPKDAKEALHWYLAADKFGYIPATYVVGEIYEFGYAGEKNIPKAISYFKKAGLVGYAPSQYELGIIYYNGADGVPQDKKTAGDWLILAAKAGNANALFACGRMYDLGEGGVQADSKLALTYYREAALKGQPDAEYAVGQYFYTGDVVAKDLKTARKFFQESALQGNADAMFDLAVMLVLGEGGDSDRALAYVWFKLAAASGLEKAKAAFAELEPKLTPQEREKADKLLNSK